MKVCYCTIELDSIELDVRYLYTPPCRGLRDSLNGIPGAGPPLTPDEDECVELESVSLDIRDVDSMELLPWLSEETKQHIEALVLKSRRARGRRI